MTYPCSNCNRDDGWAICTTLCERPQRAPARVMRPTEALRFVERTQDQGDGTARRIRVLQQGWAPVHGGGHIEWQDVPLVVEP